MGTKTAIAWTDHSQNYWWGCLKVSEECKNCYAETFSKRVGKDIWGPASTTSRWILGDKNWQNPYKWNKQAQSEQRIHRVFCSSMSDLYEDHPEVAETRNRFFNEVIPETPWLAWQFLTKRPENILTMSPISWQDKWPDNVWVGTSVGTQARAEERIPELLKVPATIRFLSCEPLLEQVDLTPWLPQLQWIICGGESGPKHRPFNPDWAKYLRTQCQEANVAYFFKQVGGLYHDSGGSLLDGEEWKAFPMTGNGTRA